MGIFLFHHLVTPCPTQIQPLLLLYSNHLNAVARTYSDVPADPPQNVTVEASSSKSLIVRWEPPPPESQNGVITGYKLRWRKKGDESEVVTTDGSRRLFAITSLKNGKEYQVKASVIA